MIFNQTEKQERGYLHQIINRLKQIISHTDVSVKDHVDVLAEYKDYLWSNKDIDPHEILSLIHIYRLSFHRAVSSIYQRGIQMGVTNGTNYGTDTLFAVEGGDIYHQGTVTTPSGSSYTSRACRFYASEIIARGLLELKSQLRFNNGAYESAYPYSWSYSSNRCV